MSWCEQLTHRPSLPDWNGPKRVQNLFAQPKEDKPQPEVTDGRRVCSACKNDQPATSDYFYTHTVRGRVYFHSKCKVCMNAEQAARDKRRRGSKK